ncbi:MAG: hypothetical protein J5738_02510 [Lachnospiraceae bacterium]|nr:hypothetical protein [Lachnospiraceae bacterium]MBO4669054.1 hypothetical protein [Lachnospiraceae bacterium]MBR5666402.1 hypothetical protein [Lachnospiraceae bacterium]
MSWFFFALICLLGWGFADLFYKKGTDEEDRYSHLKIAVWVGLVMGVCAFALFPLSETLKEDFSLASFAKMSLKYSPASLCYIISMVIGYAGLRYLELSIVSPVQNASGALSAVCMFIYFLLVGKITSFTEEFGILDIIGSVLIVLGVIALAVVERRLSEKENEIPKEERRYRMGALALIFPLLYCIFDTVGTAADGIILDEETGLGIGEIDVIILYGITFFIAGIVCWIYLRAKTGSFYNPFKKSERNKGIAACCEEFGQVFYVYAMAAKPILAAPMVASYCIVSVILSRLIIKEKLKASQYACIISVIIGIVLLGISEGLAE